MARPSATYGTPQISFRSGKSGGSVSWKKWLKK
jgi:hypothetical protein